MNPRNVPFELISFRGLLKSFEDIAKGNFMNHGQAQNHIAIKDRKNIFISIKNLFVFIVLYIVCAIENCLFTLMQIYDANISIPLKRHFSKNTRFILQSIFNLKTFLVFQMIFLLPISLCLKAHQYKKASLLFMLQSLLGYFNSALTNQMNDEKVQPGCFLIRFCNKLSNIITLFTILQSIDLYDVNVFETIFCYLLSYIVIFCDIWICIEDIDIYFQIKYKENHSGKMQHSNTDVRLKRKLESIGILSICLAFDESFHVSGRLLNPWGILGFSCLALSIHMSFKCFDKFSNENLKLNMSSTQMSENMKLSSSLSADDLLHRINRVSKTNAPNIEKETTFRKLNIGIIDLTTQNQTFNSALDFEFFMQHEELLNNFDSFSNEIQPKQEKTNRVDTVYTIGCFDLFHEGHIKLLHRMRKFGRKLFVGVHDSRSIYKLKNRVPVDSTEKRMLNVKEYADVVFCIASTDPSNYMTCIVHLENNESALYVRGDDMPNFPSRDIIEKLMPIKLIPYTQGISSTQIRNEKYSHIEPNDEEYLEKNC